MKMPPETMPEWRISDAPVSYSDALAEMEDRVAAIHEGTAAECLWLLEHPLLFTGGTSSKEADLLWHDRFPVFRAGRGGEYTYHGPGQRVVYVMLDLNHRGRDVRAYVTRLEQWICAALAEFGVKGEIRRERPGVWVRRRDLNDPGREDKIAAIGVRIRRWVTFHGISINVEPDLSHYEGIVPCGMHNYGVTSLVDLGLTTPMTDLDMALKKQLPVLLNP